MVTGLLNEHATDLLLFEIAGKESALRSKPFIYTDQKKLNNKVPRMLPLKIFFFTHRK